MGAAPAAGRYDTLTSFRCARVATEVPAVSRCREVGGTQAAAFHRFAAPCDGARRATNLAVSLGRVTVSEPALVVHTAPLSPLDGTVAPVDGARALAANGAGGGDRSGVSRLVPPAVAQRTPPATHRGPVASLNRAQVNLSAGHGADHTDDHDDPLMVDFLIAEMGWVGGRRSTRCGLQEFRHGVAVHRSGIEPAGPCW